MSNLKFRSWHQEYWHRLSPPPAWKMENIIVEPMPHTFEHISMPPPWWQTRVFLGTLYCVAGAALVALLVWSLF